MLLVNELPKEEQEKYWADNQAMQAKIEGMEGGIQLNKMIMDAAEEKLRVAEEALEVITRTGDKVSMIKTAKKALSTIRGK